MLPPPPLLVPSDMASWESTVGFANSVAIIWACGHTTPASPVLLSALHRRDRAGLPGSEPVTCFFMGRAGTGLGVGPLQQPPRCSGPIWPMLPESTLLSRRPRIPDPFKKQILWQPRQGFSIMSPIFPPPPPKAKATSLIVWQKPTEEEMRLVPQSLPCSGPLRRQLPGGRVKTFQRILGNRKQSQDPLPWQFAPLPSVGARITKKLPFTCLLWSVGSAAWALW